MIEPTDEMREVFLTAEAAFRKAEFARLGFKLHVPTLNRQAFAAGLTAVFALVERHQPHSARKGYETAIAVLRGVAERTGSPAAAWCADYLLADPDRLAPPPL